MGITITDIKDFPSKQAEKIQNHLKELDEQGKLFDYFKEQYGSNLGKPNSLANYILKHWNENGKRLYLEYTGVEVCNDKHTVVSIGVKLNKVSYGSGKYFLWKCNKCQYEWVVGIHDRVNKNSGCPSCGGTSLIKGKNDLETFCKEYPEYQKLLTEFMGKDIDGNKILPSEISKGSRKEVWWKCSNTYCSYEWTAQVANRTAKIKRGCPACSGHILIPGKNDLETYCHQHPEFSYILNEFEGEDENNNHILTSEVARASRKRVYWRCRTCHKLWLAKISDRTSTNKRGCPHCAEYLSTSFPEQYIYHSLLQLFPKTQNRQKDKILNYEYDIVVPELNLCIEYSGYNWHQDKLERDQDKADHCRKNGIQFLQIYAHNGVLEEEDTYTKEKIIYKANYTSKTAHIKQLQYIVGFIIQEYSPEHSIEEINFTFSESEANKIMNKA